MDSFRIHVFTNKGHAILVVWLLYCYFKAIYGYIKWSFQELIFLKKLERGFLLFLVLVLVLTASISYIALHQTKQTSTKEQEVKKMTVALVNEDQGALFNEEKYDFGSEFIKNIEKDYSHNWYVVSRGVAENGLKRNIYNMMIVIPNDFTQKALSIDSNSPEKVTLNYKINASGNHNVKTTAEKTASQILGEFNRRIIDVYFASIVGNLQEAQDNIKTVVQKEEVYTGIYNSSIHKPLSNYTSQFKTLQDGAVLSKTTYKGLEEILTGFEDSLGNGVKANQTFSTQYQDFAKMHSTNSLLAKEFSNHLSLLDQNLNSADINQQLDNLQTANQSINNQFQSGNLNTVNILSASQAVKQVLFDTQAKLDDYDQELIKTIASDIQGSLKNMLKENMSGTSPDESLKTILLAQPDKKFLDAIKNQIDILPSVKLSEIDVLDLDPTTSKQLKNVIAVTNKFNEEFNYSIQPGNSMPLLEKINLINKEIENGIELTDTVEITNKRKPGQIFTISLPEQYQVNNISLLFNGKEIEYSRDEAGNIILPESTKGTIFTVKLLVALKEGEKANIFQPLTWNWKMKYKDTEEDETTEPPTSPDPDSENPGDSEETPAKIVPMINKSKANSLIMTTNNDSIPANGVENEAGDEQPAENDEKQNQTEADSSEGNNNPTTDESSGSTEKPSENSDQPPTTVPSNPVIPPTNEGDHPGEEQPPVVEKVKVIDDTINHKIMSPIQSASPSELIQSAAESVASYQRLYQLYKIYFGLNMEEPNLERSLKESSNESSLYSLFNKQDINDIVANYVAEEITDDIRTQTVQLQSRIDNYKNLVKSADEHSSQLAATIVNTSEQAKVLNTNLAETLKDAESLREISKTSLDKQGDIVNSEDEESSKVLDLNGELVSLMELSKQLADQSRGNLTSAEGVYQTFDTLEKEAKSIQNSGVTLVNDASNLSNNMTKKLMDDKDFAKNFATVLANSRIGDRQNENLYGFLSNPVKTQNSGLIQAAAAKDEDGFRPYFIVLICFIVALFSAYVISNFERKRMQKDSFEGERSLISNNIPITAISAGVGIVEGLIISFLSGYFMNLEKNQFIIWIGLITIIVLAILMTATYLLRQIKMIGMFILLIVMSLYLFLADALGLHLDKTSLAYQLKEYSPLQYIERIISQFSDAANLNMFIITSIIFLIVISVVGNLLVINRYSRNESDEDAGIREAL